MAIVRAKLTGGIPITSEIAVVSCRIFTFFFILCVTMALFGFSLLFLGLGKFKVSRLS